MFTTWIVLHMSGSAAGSQRTRLAEQRGAHHCDTQLIPKQLRSAEIISCISNSTIQTMNLSDVFTMKENIAMQPAYIYENIQIYV